MSGIDKIICNALLMGKGVSIPGIGTLKTSVSKPERISGKRYSAPRRTVSFIPAKKQGNAEGEDLLSMIGERGQMNAEAAGRLFDEWLEEASQGESITVKSVGTIVGGRFITDDTFDKIINPFQLPEVEMERRASRWPLWVAGAVIIAGVGVGACLYLRNANDIADRNGSVIPTPPAEQTTQPATETATTDVATEGAESAAEPAVTSEQVIEQSLREYADAISAEQGETEYRLVAGVFSTKKNAEKFIAEDMLKLGAAGYTAVPFSNNRTAVYVFSSSSRAEVENRNAQLRSLIPDMWVWEKKKD